jgi:ABC-2 type transport system permease protein
MSHYHPLRGLYISRLREFYRQPARLFWVYGFPTVLALGLGLAFQSRVPESVQVDLVKSTNSGAIEKALRDHDKAARAEKRQGVLLNVVSEEEAARRLRTGKTPLVVMVKDDAPRLSANIIDRGITPVTYRFDPTRPEATSARGFIDSILQRAAGRVDPV